MFRVRVGQVPDPPARRKTVAARLKKEDQFKPWITR
jgi:hypothetical protein